MQNGNDCIAVEKRLLEQVKVAERRSTAGAIKPPQSQGGKSGVETLSFGRSQRPVIRQRLGPYGSNAGSHCPFGWQGLPSDFSNRLLQAAHKGAHFTEHVRFI